jgi:hypothetical protein
MHAVQVNPEAATIVYVNTPRGGELTLDPGREVVARVVSAGGGGSARINLAGQVLDVTTSASLRAGDEVRLAVTRADETGVRLAIVTPDAAASARGGAGGADALVRELARAGVPVNAQVAAAAARVAEQLGGGSTAARAVAGLAGRDLVLSPAAAGRVAAALDMAGSLGPALSSLAARSGDVAAALPGGAPTAAALRALLAPGLSSGELAIARIVQATQAAAPGGPTTVPAPPSSSAAVIQNYLTSQLSIGARLDQLASQNTTLGTSALLQARGIAAPVAPALPGGLAADALQATLRGQQAAPAPPAAPASTPAAAPAAAGTGTTVGAAPPATTTSAQANASAAAATGAANALATPTNARAAGAIVELANLATRFAPAVAPAAGSIATASSSAARGINAAVVAQQAGPAGSAGSTGASIAGAGASGDPMPLVTALHAFLASPGSESDTARLLHAAGGSTGAALATAIRTLPEGQALQLAGKLLDLLPASSQLSGPALADLRAGVHAALDQLGRALQPPGGGDLAALRAALERVAAQDPRPSVASDAARLLASIDGQQILSRTASGADPGYVYFQVPLPDGRGAEVLVRREPGRRAISFDEFRIAFLLDTERLGTLMIELDAHPAGIRADVRTDIPALEPFLRERTEQLVEPLARESRRPVTVTTGVFEQEPPTSLLEPRLGALAPGATEFYA